MILVPCPKGLSRITALVSFVVIAILTACQIWQGIHFWDDSTTTSSSSSGSDWLEGKDAPTTINTTLTSSSTTTTTTTTKETPSSTTSNTQRTSFFSYPSPTGNPLAQAASLLNETLCLDQSRFRSLQDNNNNNNDDDDTLWWNVSNQALIHEWEFKLLYLAIYDFHHRPPTTTRNNNMTTTNNNNKNETTCSNVKYLVTSIPDIGLGAAFRLGAVPHILMGLASDRVPVFVANWNTTGTPYHIPRLLTQPWKLTSCPQHDMTCILLPTTPCLPTLSDLHNRTVLSEPTIRPLRRTGSLDASLDDQRVLVVTSALAPPRFDKFVGSHATVRRKLSQRIQYLLEEWEAQVGDLLLLDKNPQQQQQQQQQEKFQAVRSVLRAAAQRIPEMDPPDEYEHYYYGHRYYRIPHAILLYLLRPNAQIQQRLQTQMQQIFGPHHSHSHESLGMPIRGSDKCDRESTCLPFEKYMKLANETWHGHGHRNSPQQQQQQQQQVQQRSSDRNTTWNHPHYHYHPRGQLIVTTEDKIILEQRHAYTATNHTNHTTSTNHTTTTTTNPLPPSFFPMDFVINQHDSFQGTGNVKVFGTNADDIMVSSLIALQMQLHAGHVFGNCCSNFHLLLFDLIKEGCGLFVHQPTCLQETTSEYNICCQWTKTKECQAKRAVIAVVKEQQERQTKRSKTNHG